MSTTQKLWLGFGLLLLLLIASGLFVARRLALIEQALETIMAVQEPATAASYEMGVNVSSTGAAVLAYVQTGDPADRARVDSLMTSFDRLKRDYDTIARSAASRRLGDQIAAEHAAYRIVADSLAHVSDQGRRAGEVFARDAEETARLIQGELTDAQGGHDAATRQLLASRLEGDVATIGSTIGHLLRTRDPRYRTLISEREADFRASLQQLGALRGSDDQQLALARIERSFDEFATQGRQLVDRIVVRRLAEASFIDHGTRVAGLVSEGIHSLARTDLIEAQRSARRALHTSLIAVLVLLVAGIVIGCATALPTGRSIILGEARIRDQAEQLRLRMEDLARTHRNKDEFLGVLGHELRNPLAPLSNALYVLTAHDDGLPRDVREAHAMMRRQVHNISRLVDDLLDVSRINEGKITLRREPVDLGAMCAEVAADLDPDARQHRHRLERSGPDRGPWVSADPTRLAQVVSNLVQNAIRYTPDGGVIRIEVESNDGHARLRVRDTGVGIEPEMRSRIFEPFVQGDGASAVRGGLGIGLTLVRRLVELHGGRVDVDSAGPGLGSTFTVELPALPSGPEPAAAPPPSADTPPRNVLVVDDNLDAADTLAKLLELWGHRVRTANDGATALAAARSDPPELVLLDIGLPGMNGYEVGSQLRLDPRTQHATIIALTGFGQEDARRQALDVGFDDHIAKPVSPEALRALLARTRV